MTTKAEQTTVKAADNPDLVNSMISQALANEKVEKQPVTIMPPSDTVVTLPGGYLTFTGEVIKEAEVRELNGKDEETIAKSMSVGKALLAVLNRGVVRIGDERATEDMLDSLLAGDRDFLMVAIYKATFGEKTELEGVCLKCNEFKTVSIDINQDIKVRPMSNPRERNFDIECKVGTVNVSLPNGAAQKELVNNADKSVAELTTILLENCVNSIDGLEVYSREQVLKLGITDRRLIAEQINKRNFGPQFEDVVVVCPDCESEVRVPVNLGTLFRI